MLRNKLFVRILTCGTAMTLVYFLKQRFLFENELCWILSHNLLKLFDKNSYCRCLYSHYSNFLPQFSKSFLCAGLSTWVVSQKRFSVGSFQKWTIFKHFKVASKITIKNSSFPFQKLMVQTALARQSGPHCAYSRFGYDTGTLHYNLDVWNIQGSFLL